MYYYNNTKRIISSPNGLLISVRTLPINQYEASPIYFVYSIFRFYFLKTINCDYCSDEGIYSYTNTKFSMQLLFLKENGSIVRPVERRKTNKSNNYIIK